MNMSEARIFRSFILSNKLTATMILTVDKLLIHVKYKHKRFVLHTLSNIFLLKRPSMQMRDKMFVCPKALNSLTTVTAAQST